jgi:beta-lactamase superfamily II metal-dependent hydrolase
MKITIFDVEHGACALIQPPSGDKVALIDCGTNSTTGWNPASMLKTGLRKSRLEYLFITNADQDHYANLAALKEEIYIKTFTKNPTVSADDFEKIKLKSGPLSTDAKAYKELLSGYKGTVSEPFNQHMGGIEKVTFYNRYPDFEDTNNLSLVIFIKFGSFKILFPGDLEKKGWLGVLADPEFQQELKATTILVAPHHGRENGYCEELFQIWKPQAVVVSDKPIVHRTQNVPQYQNCVVDEGINVMGQTRRRRVLTTRKDGAVTFDVSPDGSYRVYTSK